MDYTDPYFKGEIVINKKKIKKVKINYNKISKYSALIIIADHDKFNYKKLKEKSSIIVDTRGRYKDLSYKIIKA